MEPTDGYLRSAIALEIMSLQHMKMRVRALRKGQDEALSDLRTSDTVRHRAKANPDEPGARSSRNNRPYFPASGHVLL